MKILSAKIPKAIVSSVVRSAHSKESHGRVYLISFPRSGNTWIRALLEKYTKLPSKSIYERIDDYGRVVDGPLFYDTGDVVIWKSHRFTEENFSLKKNDKVIFIVRDFKDAILKHNPMPLITRYFSKSIFTGYFKSLIYIFSGNTIAPWKKLRLLGYKIFISPFNWLAGVIRGAFEYVLGIGLERGHNPKWGIDKVLRLYCQLLRDFESCENEKLLIYYEDLVTDFSNNFRKIIKFMSLPEYEDKINELASAQDKVFEETKDSLAMAFGKTLSGDMNFIGRYKAGMPLSEAKKMNEFVYKNYPQISEKYLARYLHNG